MYDTIGMYLDSTDTNISYIDYVPQFLDNCGIHKYGDSIVITGWKDGLQINVSQNKVKVAKGSLGKFYLNDAFQTLRRGDSERAIERLSDALHLPMKRAKITRIDLGQTLSMTYPEEVYYKYLGVTPYYKRKEQPNGIYYDNGNSQMAFYGKVREQKDKGQFVESIYKNLNLLRYEYRTKNRIGKAFNMPQVYAKDLYQEDFYMNLLDRWGDKYSIINKISKKMDSLKITGSTKEIMDQLAFIGLLEVGYIDVYEKVREWQVMGVIDKKQASDLRKKLKAVSGIKIASEGNDLIIELDQKINEAINNYR